MQKSSLLKIAIAINILFGCYTGVAFADECADLDKQINA